MCKYLCYLNLSFPKHLIMYILIPIIKQLFMSILNKLNQFKDLRNQAKNLQNQLKEEKVTATSGGVNLVMDGNQDIITIDIDTNLLTVDKKNKLENAIKDAHADALKKVRKILVTKMQASGIKLPGME